MRTNVDPNSEIAAIIKASDAQLSNQQATGSEFWPDVARARAFVEPLISGMTLPSGEDSMMHADAVVKILKDLQSSDSLQAAAYLIYAVEHIQRPKEILEKAFGDSMANLVVDTYRLIHVQRMARESSPNGVVDAAHQTESARKMLLAFSRDLRSVMLRLTSRLQTLRYAAEHKIKLTPNLAEETLYVFAPLANRLGIWQLKWQLEDLAFRFLEPKTYRKIADLLAEERTEREAYIHLTIQRLSDGLAKQGIHADVTGRPKHIYSIWKKMSGKGLDFSELHDIRAFRVIVPTVEDCYTALAWINDNFESLPEEFDDYIVKPKINGYQSLHVIAKDMSKQGAGKFLEIQIRTQKMHDLAESGVAAHWAYKEAGTKGYSGVIANSAYDARIAFLRQLLAWERDLTSQAVEEKAGLFDDRIYVMTPDASLIELPQKATPLDFAYAIHTELGHRCRGAKVDGQMVPLDTQLKNGQTVEIIAAKEGGPSRDWLNPESAYLVSSKAKAKVRAWFNAQIAQQMIAKGREQVEKLLQREGKTAVKLESLATQLGFKNADMLFELVGKDEYSLRHIEQLFHPELFSPAAKTATGALTPKKPSSTEKKGGVLVVGMGSLLTQLAQCCKPAPPDEIVGYVTRGKGVSIHRKDCLNVRELNSREPGRIIDVAWDKSAEQNQTGRFPVDIEMHVQERHTMLQEVSEILAKEKLNIVNINTHFPRSSKQKEGKIIFTIEVPSIEHLQKVLRLLRNISGIQSAKRR